MLPSHCLVLILTVSNMSTWEDPDALTSHEITSAHGEKEGREGRSHSDSEEGVNGTRKAPTSLHTPVKAAQMKTRPKQAPNGQQGKSFYRKMEYLDSLIDEMGPVSLTPYNPQLSLFRFLLVKSTLVKVNCSLQQGVAVIIIMPLFLH